MKIPLRLFARCVKTARHPKKAVSLLLKRHAAELAAEVKKFPGFKPHGLSMFAGGEVNAEGWLTTKLEGFDPAELLRERMGIDDLDERLVSAGVSNNPSCPSTSSASPTS